MLCRVPETLTDSSHRRRSKIVWDPTGDPTVPSSLPCRFAQLGGHCGTNEGRTDSEPQPPRPRASSRLAAAHRYIVRLPRPRVRRGPGPGSGYIRAAMEVQGDSSRGRGGRCPDWVAGCVGHGRLPWLTSRAHTISAARMTTSATTAKTIQLVSDGPTRLIAALSRSDTPPQEHPQRSV